MFTYLKKLITIKLVCGRECWHYAAVHFFSLSGKFCWQKLFLVWIWQFCRKKLIFLENEKIWLSINFFFSSKIKSQRRRKNCWEFFSEHFFKNLLTKESFLFRLRVAEYVDHKIVPFIWKQFGSINIQKFNSISTLMLWLNLWMNGSWCWPYSWILEHD